jgi:hypothetical protein
MTLDRLVLVRSKRESHIGQTSCSIIFDALPSRNTLIHLIQFPEYRSLSLEPHAAPDSYCRPFLATFIASTSNHCYLPSHQSTSNLDSQMEEEKGLLNEESTKLARLPSPGSGLLLRRMYERHNILVLSHLFASLCFYLPVKCFVGRRSSTFEACHRKISTWCKCSMIPKV